MKRVKCSHQKTAKEKLRSAIMRFGLFSILALSLLALHETFGEVITASAITVSVGLHLSQFVEELTA